MSLKRVCKKTPLEDYVREGLGALGTDRGHIQFGLHANFHESLNLEEYVKQSVDENVPVWDYLTSTGESLRKALIHALEVHPCEPEETAAVVRKFEWSVTHLATVAPAVHVDRWVWIASGASHIIQGISPEFFKLQQAGIDLCTRKGYSP